MSGSIASVPKSFSAQTMVPQGFSLTAVEVAVAVAVLVPIVVVGNADVVVVVCVVAVVEGAVVVVEEPQLANTNVIATIRINGMASHFFIFSSSIFFEPCN